MNPSSSNLNTNSLSQDIRNSYDFFNGQKNMHARLASGRSLLTTKVSSTLDQPNISQATRNLNQTLLQELRTLATSLKTIEIFIDEDLKAAQEGFCALSGNQSNETLSAINSHLHDLQTRAQSGMLPVARGATELGLNLALQQLNHLQNRFNQQK